MKKRKNLKGFTLIELIIVMAIFGILMTAVMQVITPLNKLSKRASIQEANAAVVDNMKTYLEGTLRYASAVEVFSGGLVDDEGNLIYSNNEEINKTKSMSSDAIKEKFGYVTPTGSPVYYDDEKRQQAAVVQFIDNHYSNRLNPGTENPLSGKVRLLKIDNANGGKVTEYEYNFTAGYTYTHFGAGEEDENGIPTDVKKRVNATVSESKVGSKDVFNSVYYEDYSFYFVPGYNETITQSDTSLIDREEAAFADDKPEDYYASVERIKTPSGNVYGDFTPNMFSLSVMSYKNDADDSGNPTHRMNLKDDSSTTADESLIPVFKSPFALSNINMSLVNINSEYSNQSTNELFGALRYHGTEIEGIDESGDPIEGETYSADKVVKKNEKIEFYHIGKTNKLINHGEVEASLNDECIYIIYTLPEYK